MNWSLPNILTASRLPLAAVFFVLLSLYPNGWGCSPECLLGAAFVVFAAAGVTDFLDGFLARRLNEESAFGRIADPFVDKVLIVGAFAILAGSNFSLGVLASRFERDLPEWLTGGMASAIQPWMVVVIMGREFIVSAVRSHSESRGVKFPATYAGKVKFILQVIAISAVLLQMMFLPLDDWAVIVKIALVWLAVVVTVASGLIYVGRAHREFMANP